MVFIAMSGLALWLVIDHSQYPTMSMWVRLGIAGVLAAMGLWFALAETADARTRPDSLG